MEGLADESGEVLKQHRQFRLQGFALCLNSWVRAFTVQAERSTLGAALAICVARRTGGRAAVSQPLCQRARERRAPHGAVMITENPRAQQCNIARRTFRNSRYGRGEIGSSPPVLAGSISELLSEPSDGFKFTQSSGPALPVQTCGAQLARHVMVSQQGATSAACASSVTAFCTTGAPWRIPVRCSRRASRLRPCERWQKSFEQSSGATRPAPSDRTGSSRGGYLNFKRPYGSLYESLRIRIDRPVLTRENHSCSPEEAR
jgi:hypothetical protein